MGSYKAPTDCVQYFTGVSGSVKSYNYAGSQILAGQRYNNCIRTEKGYCAIQWKESSTTSPDPFSLDSISVVGSNGVGPPAPAVLCDTAYIAIPNLSPDGRVGSLHSCTWHSSLSICNYWVQFGLYSAALLDNLYWSEVWSSLTPYETKNLNLYQTRNEHA